MKAISSRKHRVLMIQMNRVEALWTIKSLSEQLARNNPNAGRYEKYLDNDGKNARDFSIAVIEEPPKQEKKCK